MRLIKPSGTTGAVQPQQQQQRVKRLFNLRAWSPKLLLGRLCGILIVLMVIALVINFIDTHKKTPTAVDTSKDPCAFFTLDDAKSLLGKTAAKNSSAAASQTSKDIDTNTCSYAQSSYQAGQNVNKLKTAYVKVQAPKTANGKMFNEFFFSHNKPKNAQSVQGYGQQAYWDPASGTLNILKGDKWISLSNGTLVTPSARNLNDAKKLADIVINKV